MLRKIFSITALLGLLLLSAEAFSEEVDGELFKKESPVEITADSITYDKATDTYHAVGDVEIVQEGTTLKSDAAILDMAAGVATATGDVRVVDEGGNALRGKNLQFNMKDKTSVLVNGRIFYRQDNIHITGDEIRKTGPESYFARRIDYTTCDCPDPEKEPAWKFSATSADITVGEFLTGWNARFYVKGVPVLYSPYITIPIKRDRQTGFLQPRPGYSGLRGFVLDNTFFWAISKNTDATFYLDVETARGLGKGVEYRYIRNRKSSGELFFYHFQEKDISRVREFRQDLENLSRPQDANNNRWRLNYIHNELLGDNINIRANLNLISDDEYFIDFGDGSDERSLESIESNISISRNWSVYSLVAQFRVFNNLLDEEDAETLQRLPEITFNNADKKVFNTPFYISSESSLVHFWRKEGMRGERLDIHPRLSLPMRPGGYFDFTPSIAPRGTLYLVSEDPDGRYSDRFLYDVRADLTTTFIRIYDANGETLQALRHTIRPNIIYTYIPESVQADLPSFDAIDRIAPANSITYSVNSTVTGRHLDDGVKSYFDYLYLDLSQTYNIYEAQRKLASPTDERRPFSEINGELILRPNPYAVFTAKGRFDVYDNRFNTYDTSVAAVDKRGDSLNISHRFVKDGANYLEGALRARVNRAVDLTYLNRYSFDDNRPLETSYGIEYTHQCWSSTLTFTERLEEKIVYLTFNLLGIGKVAGIQGRLEPQ